MPENAPKCLSAVVRDNRPVVEFTNGPLMREPVPTARTEPLSFSFAAPVDRAEIWQFASANDLNVMDRQIRRYREAAYRLVAKIAAVATASSCSAGT